MGGCRGRIGKGLGRRDGIPPRQQDLEIWRDPPRALLIHSNTIMNETSCPFSVSFLSLFSLSVQRPRSRSLVGRFPATLAVSVGPTPRPKPVRVARRPMAPHEREGHQLRWGGVLWTLRSERHPARAERSRKIVEKRHIYAYIQRNPFYRQFKAAPRSPPLLPRDPLPPRSPRPSSTHSSLHSACFRRDSTVLCSWPRFD